ncbi:MAG: hypothetical protein AAFV19_11390 [Pseudomonadota bacterium]
MTTQLSMEEFQALAEIAKARREVMQHMFSGTKLVFGTMDKMKAGKDLLSGGKDVVKNTKKLLKGPKEVAKPQIKQAAQEFIKAAADVDSIEDVIEVITGEVLSELISEITPYFGIVSSAFKAGQAGKAVAEDAYALYKFDSYKNGFLQGDPQAAAEAVKLVIERDLARHSIDLARHSASTGAKIAGILGDGGTATTAAVGTASALAALGMKLTALGVDIKQMKDGNKRLAQPDTLDLTVFKEAPILGCHLLTCADTSSVANFFVADIGLPGWMDKVENLKSKQMDPLLKIASKHIESSPLQLEGLASDKGTYTKKGFFAKKKSDATKWLKKKVSS